MPAKVKYKTRQREQILTFLRTIPSTHFTAADVCAFFKEHEIPIGTATVYRQLEQLVQEGKGQKYIIDENSSACFEYIGDEEVSAVPSCYHLKCERCGKLIHLECDEITEFERHITGHHGFRIDPARTVFYGVCAECLMQRVI